MCSSRQVWSLCTWADRWCMPCALWLVRDQASCLGYDAACRFEHCLAPKKMRSLWAAATCVDQSKIFMTNYAKQNFPTVLRQGTYSCAVGESDGQCDSRTGARMCPVTCGHCGAMTPTLFVQPTTVSLVICRETTEHISIHHGSRLLSIKQPFLQCKQHLRSIHQVDQGLQRSCDGAATGQKSQSRRHPGE